MPFTTSNVQTTVLGNLRATYGQYTDTEAGGSSTIGVAGGQVWLVLFNSQDTSGAISPWTPRWSASTSGAITTVTIYGLEGVSTGSFFIVHS